MDLKPSGKRVLVTGGNSGLGAAMVRAFAVERARVAINYVVHAEQTAQLADRLRAGGKHDLISKIAIGRIGEPEDMAGMAVALASDVASCGCSLACRW